MPRSTRNSSDSFAGPSPATATASTSAASHQPSPALVASLVEALKDPLTSMVNSAVQAATASSRSTIGNSPAISPSNVPAPVIPQPVVSIASSHLQNSAIRLASPGVSAANWQSSPFAPSSSGMSQLSVPAFISPFCPPAPSSSTTSASTTSLNPIVSSSIDSGVPPAAVYTPSPLSSLPMDQPFVVGPGFSPIPYKVVSKMVAGKFVNLEELLPENILSQEHEPQILLDGRLVFAPSVKKAKRQILDITTWFEAFSIFSLILGTYFPSRKDDLLKYKLLILRTFRQFSGSAWLNYDREFRELAAAERCTTWATMNVQLYNFHTAGAHVRPRLAASSSSSSSKEPQGNVTAKVFCHSWNAGLCKAPNASCRFRHVCSLCEGDHRKSACSDHFRGKRNERARSADPSEHKRNRRY